MNLFFRGSLPLCYVLFSTFLCNAQMSAGFPQTMNQTGQGSASIADDGLDAFYHNPAALTSLINWEIALGVENFGFPQLNRPHALTGATIGKQFVGLGLAQLSFEGLRETQLSLGVARQLLPNFALGFRVDHLHLAVAEYQSRSAFTFCLGMQMQMTESLQLGFVAQNPFQWGLDSLSVLPNYLGLGLQFKAADQLYFMAEQRFFPGAGLQFRAGLRYYLQPEIQLQLGFGTDNQGWSCGVLWKKWKRLNIGMALRHHPWLAWQAVVGGQFKMGNQMQN